jgi:prepilin peptidase CpaA
VIGIFETLWMGMVAAYTSACLFTDVRWGKFPNWIPVASLAVALVSHTIAGGLAGLLFAAGGFGTGFGLLFVLWLIGGGGGGDVKMMAALGAWLGAWMMVEVFVATAVLMVLISSIMTVVNAFRSKGSREKHERGSRPEAQKNTSAWRIRVPYAVPVVIATWLVVGYTLSRGALIPYLSQ